MKLNLQGKKVAFLGDSITRGDGTSNINNRYANVFSQMTGCEVYVDGIGGTRIAKQKIYSGHPDHDKDFIGRVDNLPADADIVVVFGGTNDFGHGDAPLGTFDDRSEYTFYGALHTLIGKLIKKYPETMIVFIEPPHRLDENNTTNALGLPCKPLKEYIKAVRCVCKHYRLPVLKMFDIDNLQLRDGLHPGDIGARMIAQLLEEFIYNLLNKED